MSIIDIAQTVFAVIQQGIEIWKEIQSLKDNKDAASVANICISSKSHATRAVNNALVDSCIVRCLDLQVVHSVRELQRNVPVHCSMCVCVFVASSSPHCVPLLLLYARLLLACSVYSSALKDFVNSREDNVHATAEENEVLLTVLQADKRLIEGIVSDCTKIAKKGALWNAVFKNKDSVVGMQEQLLKHIDFLTFLMMKDVWRGDQKDQVRDVLKDAEARKLWLLYVGSKTREVSIELLKDAYQQYLNTEYNSKEIPELLPIMRALFGNTKLVTIYQFQTMLYRFGPLKHFLEKASAVCDA